MTETLYMRTNGLHPYYYIKVKDQVDIAGASTVDVFNCNKMKGF